MAYTAEISRSNPTCFVFLIDQSGSMEEQLADGNGEVERLKELRTPSTASCRCLCIAVPGETILDRYYIGVIGYGGEIGLGFPSDEFRGRSPPACEHDRQIPTSY